MLGMPIYVDTGRWVVKLYIPQDQMEGSLMTRPLGKANNLTTSHPDLHNIGRFSGRAEV